MPWLLMLPKVALAVDAANGNTQWKISVDAKVEQIDEQDGERGDHHLVIIKRSEFILFMMQNMICTSKTALLWKATSLLLQKTVSAPALSLCALSVSACFKPSSTVSQLKLPTLAMPVSKSAPKTNSVLSPVLNLVTAKEMLRSLSRPFVACTSGARFHEKFANTLVSMQFFPCKADPNVRMKDCRMHCECVCVHVDNLACMMKDPSEFFAELKQRKCKFKGAGEISCHLGGDFYCDPNATLAWEAKICCKRVVNQCTSTFGAPPKECTSPINKDDHPELDVTEEASPEKIKQHQTLIGCFQWAISLGGYNVFCATMSVGRFRSPPKVDHLKRLIRICGYLKNTLTVSSASVLKALTAPILNMSHLIGPALCMVSQRKKHLLTCQLQEASLFGLPCLWMLTSCKTSLLADLSPVSSIWSIQLMPIGSANARKC
jgi:hypothetical protein